MKKKNKFAKYDYLKTNKNEKPKTHYKKEKISNTNSVKINIGLDSVAIEEDKKNLPKRSKMIRAIINKSNWT